MKRIALGAAVAAIVLSGCSKPASETDGSATALQNTSVFSAKAVWNGSLEGCTQEDQTWDTCLINTLSKTGSNEAVAAARYLIDQDNPGYISGYTQSGNVGVAEATYPARANTNTGTLLVPSQGDPVDVDQFAQQDLAL